MSRRYLPVGQATPANRPIRAGGAAIQHTLAEGATSSGSSANLEGVGPAPTLELGGQELQVRGGTLRADCAAEALQAAGHGVRAALAVQGSSGRQRVARAVAHHAVAGVDAVAAAIPALYALRPVRVVGADAARPQGLPSRHVASRTGRRIQAGSAARDHLRAGFAAHRHTSCRRHRIVGRLAAETQTGAQTGRAASHRGIAWGATSSRSIRLEQVRSCKADIAYCLICADLAIR